MDAGESIADSPGTPRDREPRSGVKLSGIVLAGGASRRMGQDKALLVYEGEPLVVRVVRRLAALCDDIVLASGDGARLDRLGLELVQVADAVADAGPLGGIVAGLQVALHPLAAVVAVDMPDLSAAVLGDLAARWDGRSPAVIARAGGGLEPLHGIYARAAAPRFRACLEAGERSVRRALERLGAQIIDFGPDAPASGHPASGHPASGHPASGHPASGHPASGHPAFARNLNEPGDLER